MRPTFFDSAAALDNMTTLRHRRACATRFSDPRVVTDAQLAYATQLRNDGATIAEITDKTGLTARPSTGSSHHGQPRRSPPKPSQPRRGHRRPRFRRHHHRPPDRWPARPVDISPPRDGISYRTAPISPPSGYTSTTAARPRERHRLRLRPPARPHINDYRPAFVSSRKSGTRPGLGRRPIGRNTVLAHSRLICT